MALRFLDANQHIPTVIPIPAPSSLGFSTCTDHLVYHVTGLHHRLMPRTDSKLRGIIQLQRQKRLLPAWPRALWQRIRLVASSRTMERDIGKAASSHTKSSPLPVRS
jgi:hypothetical protein